MELNIQVQLAVFIGFIIILGRRKKTVLLSLFLVFSPHLDQLTSNRFPKAELLTEAISGEVSAQEGVGSIGARATQITSVGLLANLAPPLKTPNSPCSSPLTSVTSDPVTVVTVSSNFFHHTYLNCLFFSYFSWFSQFPVGS